MLDEMESSNHQECMLRTREEWIDKIIDCLMSETPEEVAFWVNGIPGSRKSTFTIHASRAIWILTFSCSTSRYYILILRVITYRLAMSNATVAQEITSRLHKPRLGLLESFTNLMLEPLLEAEKLGKLEESVVIILDALDEYESRAPFLQLLSDDFSKLTHRVRFLVISQPEADLVHFLSQRKHIHETKLETGTGAIRQDVQAYLSEEMKKLVLAKASKDTKWEEMMSIFCAAADVLFIWASLAMHLVKATLLPYNKTPELTSSEEPSMTYIVRRSKLLQYNATSSKDEHGLGYRIF